MMMATRKLADAAVARCDRLISVAVEFFARKMMRPIMFPAKTRENSLRYTLRDVWRTFRMILLCRLAGTGRFKVSKEVVVSTVLVEMFLVCSDGTGFRTSPITPFSRSLADSNVAPEDRTEPTPAGAALDVVVFKRSS
jgi:hypothetical protein